MTSFYIYHHSSTLMVTWSKFGHLATDSVWFSWRKLTKLLPISHLFPVWATEELQNHQASISLTRPEAKPSHYRKTEVLSMEKWNHYTSKNRSITKLLSHCRWAGNKNSPTLLTLWKYRGMQLFSNWCRILMEELWEAQGNQ